MPGAHRCESLLDHPLWTLLLGFLYIRRGQDGVNGARHRIEVQHAAPLKVFDMRVSCAYCGAEMQPVREDARGAWTLNVSCPLSVNVKCARMKPSTALATKVRALIASAPPQGGLFE